MISESVPQSLALPRGLITVDLINERGKVVQREQAENFISLQSQEVAKWWQRFMWGMVNPVETNDAFGNKPTDMPWFPAQHIATWNDAAAEDPATETAVRGDITAWASRFPVGSPTGKRGNVDIAISEFKDTYAKWVFNWTTSQGNGTFQSVGWTRIDEATGYPIAPATTNNAVLITNAGVAGNTAIAPIWWDATNSVWITTEWVNATTQVRIVSVPPTGGTTTQICLLPANAWPAGYSLFGLARIGTDFIGAGMNTGGYSRIRRYTSAGVQTWTRDDNAIAIFMDCTIDGSGVIWTASADGKIRSHNPADGLVTATVTLTGVTTTHLCGIAYDPADGNFWVASNASTVSRNIWKVTSAGVPVTGVTPVSMREGQTVGTSQAPYAGNYYVPGSGFREPYMLNPWASSNFAITRGAGGTSPWRSNYEPLLVMKGTTLFGAGSRSINVGGATILIPLTSAAGLGIGSLGSRSRLSSPVIKDSSKSMKITYQMDFS